jgi:hypothetical protein
MTAPPGAGTVGAVHQQVGGPPAVAGSFLMLLFRPDYDTMLRNVASSFPSV